MYTVADGREHPWLYNRFPKWVPGQEKVESVSPHKEQKISLIMPMRLFHFILVIVSIDNSVTLDLYISPKSS